eukprot:359213-Chlamydomonas_euryale.AAC.6
MGPIGVTIVKATKVRIGPGASSIGAVQASTVSPQCPACRRGREGRGFPGTAAVPEASSFAVTAPRCPSKMLHAVTAPCSPSNAHQCGCVCGGWAHKS